MHFPQKFPMINLMSFSEKVICNKKVKFMPIISSTSSINYNKCKINYKECPQSTPMTYE